VKTGWRIPALAALVAIIVLVLYLPSLRSGFVYDAEAQITDGTYIHDHSHFADVLTLRVLGQDVLDGSRPVHLLSLMTDSLLWGLDPFGYHLTSIALHALVAALLFSLLMRLLETEAGTLAVATRGVIAGLVTFFFAFHPVNTEPVAEVSDREDLLATFFLLLGLLTAAFFPGPNRRTAWLRGVGLVVCMLLAAGSKETGLLAPVILGFYWLVFRRGPARSSGLFFTAASLALMVVLVVAHVALQPETSRIFPYKPGYLGGSFNAVFFIQPRIWAFLLWQIVWPSNLSADYTPENLLWITLPAALTVLAIFIGIQVWLSIKSQTAFLGAAIFWIALIPVSNFAPLFRPVADRFLYMPLVGMAAMLCGALALVSRRRISFAFVATAGAIVVCALGMLAHQRQYVFANSMNLWRDTIEHSSNSGIARNNLGYAFYCAGDYPAALEAFRSNLDLSRGNAPDSWNGAALSFEKMGLPIDAENALRKAIALEPMYAAPQKLLDAMITNAAQAAVIERILIRIRAKPPSSTP
jgi:hypothetical protein